MDTLNEANQLDKVIDVEGVTARLRRARLEHMNSLKAAGWTYVRIGKLYGMSKQQVHAIMNPEKKAQP